MRNLGFADDECGKYVSQLRELVAGEVAKGLHNWHISWGSDNINNEERARAILEIAWTEERGYSARIEAWSLYKRTFNLATGKHQTEFCWDRVLPYLRSQARIARSRFRRHRDRLLGIRNPYAVRR
jgi:hypothetical protein